jgi:hypothetical protein
MSRAKAELVKQISAEAFKDAIDLMACLAVLQESESFGEPGDVVAHALGGRCIARSNHSAKGAAATSADDDRTSIRACEI